MTLFLVPRTITDWIIFIIRLAIGLFFVWASITKIIDPETFAKAIHNYRILPPFYINIMAIILPWLEFIAGMALIIGFKYKGANILILGMLIVFIIALASAYGRGLNINCGCFSTSSTANSNLLVRLLEDVLMVAGCFIIMFDHKILKHRSKTAMKTA